MEGNKLDNLFRWNTTCKVEIPEGNPQGLRLAFYSLPLFLWADEKGNNEKRQALHV